MDLDIVFSTNPDWKPEDEPEVITLAPEKQKLRVRMERKGRGGKQVTLVTGFVGNNDDLADLAKTLKTGCGVGGSAKDGEIIIQGDHVQRVKEILSKIGYRM
ncbi:MAG: translation initiation factor [Bacteroidales bacterium]|nr:translation initiation factor [Bacteroidales bacterium]